MISLAGHYGAPNVSLTAGTPPPRPVPRAPCPVWAHDNTPRYIHVNLQEWHTCDPAAPSAGAPSVGDMFGQESDYSTHNGNGTGTGNSLDCKRMSASTRGLRFLHV